DRVDERRRDRASVLRAHHARLHAALQLGEWDGLRHARECPRARILGRILSGQPVRLVGIQSWRAAMTGAEPIVYETDLGAPTPIFEVARERWFKEAGGRAAFSAYRAMRVEVVPDEGKGTLLDFKDA